MIYSIDISNFRSIQSEKVELNQLTAIVGANSTGKSNLIKLVDFISDVARIGLQESVHRRGGINQIFPKQLVRRKNEQISMTIKLSVEPPRYWNERNLPELLVNYHLTFKLSTSKNIRIVKESLIVNSILLVSYYLSNDMDKDDSKKLSLTHSQILNLAGTKVLFRRRKDHTIKTLLNFSLLDTFRLNLFLEWLGVKSFFEQDSYANFNKDLVFKFIDLMLSNIKKGQKAQDLTILSRYRNIYTLNVHLKIIQSFLQSFRRYDLPINELRQEQNMSSETKLSHSGDNLPSVIKTLRKESPVGWQEIITTMSNISPFFGNVESKTLRAGKEYVVFEEIFGGKEIEAWESSDGTLRALAILVALETQDKGSTLLIEEPEHGLHPWAIKDLIMHFREVQKRRNLQIIFTTHSEQIINNVLIDELLISERNQKGTKYNPLKGNKQFENLTMGEIGNLWTRGLLNGVPTSM